MNVDSFIDTNVLVYAATRDPESRGKRERALRLIEEQNFALSAQVLQEFYVTVTRKIGTPLPPQQALAWIEQFEAFPCVAVEASLVKVAVEISVRHETSYWDGAILAAAQSAGASTLYSEDLNHGQYFGGVRVINPFAVPASQ